MGEGSGTVAGVRVGARAAATKRGAAAARRVSVETRAALAIAENLINFQSLSTWKSQLSGELLEFERWFRSFGWFRNQPN